MRKSLRIVGSMMLAVMLGIGSGRAVYADEIDSVIRNRDTNNLHCDSALQQIANGLYRSVDMLEIIAKQLDDDESRALDISMVI